MPPLINRGLVVIGGAKNVGKSIAASTIVPPSEMHSVIVHDGERSMEEIVERAKRLTVTVDGKRVPAEFGRYVQTDDIFEVSTEELITRTLAGKFPWKDEKQRSLMERYFLHVVGELQDIEAGKYSVYIHEPADKLEAGVLAYSQARSGIKMNSGDENFWLDAMYPVYQGVFDILRRKGISLIVLTAHLKNSATRRGSRTVVLPDKLEMAIKPRLYKDAALMIILVQDPENEDGAPAGLVIKERIPSIQIDEAGNWKIRTMLPRRIPHCNWWSNGEERDSIQWYLEHGVDLKNPLPREVWSEFERNVFGEYLSDAQMRLMVAMEERDMVASQGVANVGAPGFDPIKARRQEEIRSRMEEAGLSLQEAIDSLANEAPVAPLKEQRRKLYTEAAEGMNEEVSA